MAVKNQLLEDRICASDMEDSLNDYKPISRDELANLALAHGLFGQYDETAITNKLQCDCKALAVTTQNGVPSKDNFWDIADSFLNCVSLRKKTIEGSFSERKEDTIHEESSESLCKNTVLNHIKEYEELLSTSFSISDNESECITVPESEELDDEEIGPSLAQPVSLSKEVEEVLLSSKALHNSTRELQKFLKEIVPEVKHETSASLSGSSREQNSVGQIFSASKTIIQAADVLVEAEEFSVPVLSQRTQLSLDRCMAMLSVKEMNDN